MSSSPAAAAYMRNECNVPVCVAQEEMADLQACRSSIFVCVHDMCAIPSIFMCKYNNATQKVCVTKEGDKPPDQKNSSF